MIPFLLVWLGLSLIACGIWSSRVNDDFVEGCFVVAFVLFLIAVYYKPAL